MTAPLEGTGDARRAVDVALEVESAVGDLPRLASENADSEARRVPDRLGSPARLDMLEQVVRQSIPVRYSISSTVFHGPYPRARSSRTSIAVVVDVLWVI